MEPLRQLKSGTSFLSTYTCDPASPGTWGSAYPADGWEIGYVTDVEGNLAHFRRYVRLSRVLRFTDKAETKLELLPNKMFVFGGDVCDRGCGDLRISRMLVELKKRHMDRVVLILGNRDINKTRFTSELHAAEVTRPASLHQGPYWVHPSRQVTPLQYLHKLGDTLHRSRITRGWSATTRKAVTQSLNTRVNRLKYMLTHTMGAPLAFEYRRQELAELRGAPDATHVADAQVLDSFVDSVSEGGTVRDYLMLGQLGAVVGNTLFLHGCINSASKGFLPDNSMAEGLQPRVPGVDTCGSLTTREWVSALNAWGHAALQQWSRYPLYDASRFRGGYALRGYCYKPTIRTFSVVLETLFGNDAGTANEDHPRPISDDVVQYLNAAGVQRLVVGHKPFGSTPTILQHPTFEAVCADTSYSDYSAPDTRGKAVAEVCIQGSPTRNRTYVHGVLATGQPYSFVLPERNAVEDVSQHPRPPVLAPKKDATLAPTSTTGTPTRESNERGTCGVCDTLVGTRTQDGWLVAARVPAPVTVLQDTKGEHRNSGRGKDSVDSGHDWYLLRKGMPHYVVEEEVVSADDTRLQTLSLHSRPPPPPEMYARDAPAAYK